MKVLVNTGSFTKKITDPNTFKEHTYVFFNFVSKEPISKKMLVDNTYKTTVFLKNNIDLSLG